LKKLLSILLLCCLLLNIIGYRIVFFIRHSEIKTEIKKLILLHANNKEEEALVFALNDKNAIEKLQWDGNDEFRLNGEMYDVIEKKTQNGELFIRCISDKRETALLKKYEKINHEGNSRGRSALLLKLVGSSYLSGVNNVICLNNDLTLLYISFQQEIISSYRHDVLTPPPQS
jgi:predicted transcriptional regulator